MEIITASYMLPMTNGCPAVKNGAIVTELGKIIDVGTREELIANYPEAKVESYDEHVLMPGLVNAHCHLDLVSFHEERFATDETLPQENEFTEALMASISYKQDLLPKQATAAMQKGANRLIETGTTCVGNFTRFEGAFNLLDEMGLRAIIFPEILAGKGESAQESFEVALALVEKYIDQLPTQLQVGIGPFAPYLLSRNLLKIISQHSRDQMIPIQIHAAESFAEMELFFDSQGPMMELFNYLGWKESPPAQRKTPIQYLADIGFLEAPVSIIGGLHLSEQDFPLLARNLTKVIYCPISNKTLKHGIFPLGKLVESGIPIGLGTDIWNTRLGFNLWDEMRYALQKGSNPLPTAAELLRIATLGGARVLGLDHVIGTLEKNKQSDYIAVHTHNFDGSELALKRLVIETEPQHVTTVVVGENNLKTTR